MRKAIRTILSVAISAVLFGALTLAQSSGISNQNSDQIKDQQHHSKLSKAAFWRHHQNSDKSAQHTKGSQKSQTPAKTGQLRPASAKTATESNEHKPQGQASKTTRPSTNRSASVASNSAKSAATQSKSTSKKSTAAKKTVSSPSKSPVTKKVTPKQKTPETQTVSLKQ
jgi:hypothetical protein